MPELATFVAMPVLTEMERLHRVRGILKYAACRGITTLQLRKEPGRTKELIMAERWKQLFQKYDIDHTGSLSFDEIQRVARVDLKLREQLISDWELRQVFNSIDIDQSGHIDYLEFLNYVTYGDSKRDTRTEEQITQQAVRSVRLAVRRCGIPLEEVEKLLLEHAGLEGGGSSGTLGPEEVRRFFRKTLYLSKHECNDQNIRIVFETLDKNASKAVSVEDLLKFVRSSETETGLYSPSSNRQVGPGLIAGSRGLLPRTAPSAATVVPFNLNGRELPSASRFGMMTKAQSMMAFDTTSPAALGGSLPRVVTKNALARPLSSSAGTLGGTGLTSAADKGRKVSPRGAGHSHNEKLASTGKQLCCSYQVLTGAKTLNHVEQRLFEAGIDVRGAYHRVQ